MLALGYEADRVPVGFNLTDVFQRFPLRYAPYPLKIMMVLTGSRYSTIPCFFHFFISGSK